MSNDKSLATPFDAPLPLWDAVEGYSEKDIKSLAEINKDLGLVLPHLKADELIDQTFVLIGAKGFPSSFEGQDHAYFCGLVLADGRKVTTVFGGMAVVELLDALIASGNERPVRVTLRYVKQGRYQGYYTLE